MLSREADLYLELEVDNTPLRLAIRSGQVQFVREFIDSSSRYNLDGDNYPVLHEAAASGNVEIYNMLLEYGENEKVRDKENRTVLHVMAEHNRQRLVLKLVEEEKAKAEFEAQDNSGWTPLHQAVFSNSTEVAEILMRNGVLCYTPHPYHTHAVYALFFLLHCQLCIHAIMLQTSLCISIAWSHTLSMT